MVLVCIKRFLSLQTAPPRIPGSREELELKVAEANKKVRWFAVHSRNCFSDLQLNVFSRYPS